jgi:hypothetical protein
MSTVIQQRGRIKAPILRSGLVKLTIVNDIPEGEEVLAGTSLLFGSPVFILFDFEASHDFMSSTFVKRA